MRRDGYYWTGWAYLVLLLCCMIVHPRDYLLVKYRGYHDYDEDDGILKREHANQVTHLKDPRYLKESTRMQHSMVEIFLPGRY